MSGRVATSASRPEGSGTGTGTGTGVARLTALQREHKIAGIESVSGGDNNSPEGKTHGFDWGFVMTFVDAAARDAYLPHPEHVALGQTLLRPIADDVLVMDYAI